MDGGAWWAVVHGVVKSRTRLSDFIFTLHFHALEKAMATYSSTLAWRIPGMGEPGGLLSMGSHRVGHDWSDLAAAAAAVVGSWHLEFPRIAAHSLSAHLKQNLWDHEPSSHIMMYSILLFIMTMDRHSPQDNRGNTLTWKKNTKLTRNILWTNTELKITPKQLPPSWNFKRPRIKRSYRFLMEKKVYPQMQKNHVYQYQTLEDDRTIEQYLQSSEG